MKLHRHDPVLKAIGNDLGLTSAVLKASFCLGGPWWRLAVGSKGTQNDESEKQSTSNSQKPN
eukprot:313517-Amphidinium_carterae.1